MSELALTRELFWNAAIFCFSRCWRCTSWPPPTMTHTWRTTWKRSTWTNKSKESINSHPMSPTCSVLAMDSASLSLTRICSKPFKNGPLLLNFLLLNLLGYIRNFPALAKRSHWPILLHVLANLSSPAFMWGATLIKLVFLYHFIFPKKCRRWINTARLELT